MENVKTQEPYTQVCVWPGVIVGTDKILDFQAFMFTEFGVHVKYLEEIKTAPDMENGFPVEGTGGRNDLFFAVNTPDLGKFAIPRLQAGIRWIEDVLANELHRDNGSIYPERVKGYRTW